ncbi:MAG: hypothetical protein WC861_07130 [Candidatus Micrarchaeia archaeon]|jgi:hypothetical protein
MITEGDLSRAATLLNLLIEQYCKEPASSKTSELFDSLLELPGAYVVVREAQAQGIGDPELLASLETMLMVSATPPSSFNEENLILARHMLAGCKGTQPGIGRLLISLKEAHEGSQAGEVAATLKKIIAIGIASENPSGIIDALENFAKSEPNLAGAARKAIEMVKHGRSESDAGNATLERLAGMKKDPPCAGDIIPLKRFYAIPLSNSYGDAPKSGKQPKGKIFLFLGSN